MADPHKPMLKASDFDPEVLKLFDKYVHGGIDRRGFLEGAARFAVGGVTAAALLEALSPRFAQAQKVPPNDARIKTESLGFDSPKGYGKARGYLARPAGMGGTLPVVLVCHENRGLNPHIEDITRRLALDNFVAFAPDALFPLGGYPGDEQKALGLFGQLDQAKVLEDFVAAAEMLKARPESNGKLGIVGFCWGGTMTNSLAARLGAEVGAAAPFYGTGPSADQVANIKAPMMMFFAENDDRVNGAWPAYEAALKADHVNFQAFKYPGTQHGFNNDTTPRYDESAAKQAWGRTIELFNQTLRG